ncbi:hypothetical protein HK099_002706, partial [Clydaea vesicula]
STTHNVNPFKMQLSNQCFSTLNLSSEATPTKDTNINNKVSDNFNLKNLKKKLSLNNNIIGPANTKSSQQQFLSNNNDSNYNTLIETTSSVLYPSILQPSLSYINLNNFSSNLSNINHNPSLNNKLIKSTSFTQQQVKKNNLLINLKIEKKSLKNNLKFWNNLIIKITKLKGQELVNIKLKFRKNFSFYQLFFNRSNIKNNLEYETFRDNNVTDFSFCNAFENEDVNEDDEDNDEDDTENDFYFDENSTFDSIIFNSIKAQYLFCEGCLKRLWNVYQLVFKYL